MANCYEYKILSSKDQEILSKEIHENPLHMDAHIESFRRWVLSMPHLKCPTDSGFLLKFLRVAKYDHSKAQKRLDNFCTIRSSPKGAPLYFNFSGVNSTLIEKVFRAHQNVPIGKTSENQLVILYKTHKSNSIHIEDWNYDEMSVEVLLQVIYMSFDIILSKESTQINGIISFFDLEGCNRKTLEIWSDPELLKSITRIWQDAFPIRMRGIILYKEPMLFRVILKILEFFIAEKHRKRIFQIDNTAKIFSKIPGLEEIMPIEYGGKGGNLSDKVENWIKEVKEFHANKCSRWTFEVDENKRQSDSSNYLKNYEDYVGETLLGTPGSFIKHENIF